MDFTNIVFWLCLIPAMVCIFLTGRYILHHRTQAKQQFEKYALLIISLAFLGMASMLTLGIFLLVAFLAYGGVKLALKGGRNMRKLALGILIPLLLIPLLYYKYGYFIGTQVFNQEWNTLRDLIIPIGISFYTFQKISFCIDTLSRQQPLPKFLDFMNFASFFPQIVAGPIERRDSCCRKWKTSGSHGKPPISTSACATSSSASSSKCAWRTTSHRPSSNTTMAAMYGSSG